MAINNKKIIHLCISSFYYQYFAIGNINSTEGILFITNNYFKTGESPRILHSVHTCN